jgi:hypothetical protein
LGFLRSSKIWILEERRSTKGLISWRKHLQRLICYSLAERKKPSFMIGFRRQWSCSIGSKKCTKAN